MHDNSIFISQLEIPIRWLDLDAYGHVNNGKYFDYMSEARTSFWGETFTTSTLQFVVAETKCVYKKSFEYPGTIIVKQFVEEIGNTYLIYRYEFYLANDKNNLLYATGMAKIACFDPEKSRIARIPADILAKIKI